MNEHETHEAVVKLARRELEGHERINCWFRPEFVRALIDRLEAAHKREVEATAAKCCQLGRLAGYGASEIKHQQESVGDAAKLREALKLCLRGMCGYCRMDAEARGMTTECVNGCEVMLDAKAALSAPPRNCDLPKVVEDSQSAWLGDKLNWDEFGSPKLEIHDWLLAPATEKDGGDNAD